MLCPGQRRQPQARQATMLRYRQMLPSGTRHADPRRPTQSPPVGTDHGNVGRAGHPQRRRARSSCHRPARHKGHAWSSDEARRFLESARADHDPFYAAYVLVLVLGLRKGEVLGLTWDDVDFDAAELTIGRQLQRVRGQLLHRETKTEGSDTTLPLPSICVAALRLRRRRAGRGSSQAGQRWRRTNLIFTTATAHRSSRATSAAPTTFASPRRGYAGSPSTTPAAPADHCSPILTYIHESPCRSSATHEFSITMEIYTRGLVRQDTRRAQETRRQPGPDDRCCTSLLYEGRRELRKRLGDTGSDLGWS